MSTRHGRSSGVLLIGLGLLGFPVALAVALVPIGLGASWLVRLPAIVLCGLLVGLASGAVRAGRRMRVTPGDWDADAPDARKPIVYLRPFDIDGAEHVTAWRGHVRMRLTRRLIETTYEQRVARALSGVGPLV